MQLTVRDVGCGINARHLDRIFDPFFTTKPANKGSGLGLYNARLFVEKHRGAVSVESTEGQGTTFSVWLPEADFSENESDPESTAPVAARRLSLLLFAPPGRPLDNTAELLRIRNYHVITASAPAEVLAVLRGGDCICSGLVMLIETDDATVTELMDAVRNQQPMLKVILKMIGKEREDVRPGCARQADWVASGSASDEDFLEELGRVLHPEA